MSSLKNLTFLCVKTLSGRHSSSSRFVKTAAPLHVSDYLQNKQVLEQTERNVEVRQMTELVRDFIHPAAFYDALRGIGINYFCGVPDSLLKDFCAYVAENVPASNHVTTANEGNAIALASGYHLATGKFCLVYLQNSGLGNTVNPLVSLAASEVYSIPMLLLIGWRGEPGKRDEPQHSLQGQVTPHLLDALGIRYETLPDYIEGARHSLKNAKRHIESHLTPYALLVKRQTFLPYKLKIPEKKYPLTREQSLQIVVSCLGDGDIVVSSTGMMSRELFEYRVQTEKGHQKDFLTVGCMGHASSISLGIALQKPKRMTFCLDGDGSSIMHMGSLATIGQTQPSNFKHIIFNNGVHDSVGGQPTAAGNERFNFVNICIANGYLEGKQVVTPDELQNGVQWLRQTRGPAVLEVKVSPGSRKELGRPTRTPIQNKVDFMQFLSLSAYEES